MHSESKKSKKQKRNKRKTEAENSTETTHSDEGEPEEKSNLEHEELNDDSLKRELVEDDSDPEDIPKKKKKKKKLVSEEPGENKKSKKSIRQMKREKHAQRQADAKAVAKDELKSQCLSYLSQWKYDKQNWKFMKIKQVWLFKNKFSSTLVPDASWPLLLEYFDSAKGNIRNLLLEDANKVIQKMDEWIEAQKGEVGKDNETEELETSTEAIKPDDKSYKRARDLIQCLQE